MFLSWFSLGYLLDFASTGNYSQNSFFWWITKGKMYVRRNIVHSKGFKWEQCFMGENHAPCKQWWDDTSDGDKHVALRLDRSGALPLGMVGRWKRNVNQTFSLAVLALAWLPVRCWLSLEWADTTAVWQMNSEETVPCRCPSGWAWCPYGRPAAYLSEEKTFSNLWICCKAALDKSLSCK